MLKIENVGLQGSDIVSVSAIASSIDEAIAWAEVGFPYFTEEQKRKIKEGFLAFKTGDGEVLEGEIPLQLHRLRGGVLLQSSIFLRRLTIERYYAGGVGVIVEFDGNSMALCKMLRSVNGHTGPAADLATKAYEALCKCVESLRWAAMFGGGATACFRPPNGEDYNDGHLCLGCVPEEERAVVVPLELNQSTVTCVACGKKHRGEVYEGEEYTPIQDQDINIDQYLDPNWRAE